MIWENVQLAFSSLKANKMRALLTMLGIIIGIMSVIAIYITGDTLTKSVSGNLSSLGAGNITVSVQEKSARLGSSQLDVELTAASSSSGKIPSTSDLISEEMIANMRGYFGDIIKGVSLSWTGGNAKVQEGGLYANVTVNGVNADFFTANDIKLLDGRLITTSDTREKSRSVVVSDKFVAKMFPNGTDPLGRQVKLYKPNVIEIFTIVGIYEFQKNVLVVTTASEDEMPTPFYIPITTAKADVLEKNYTYITVVCSSENAVDATTKKMQEWFDVLYAGNESWKVGVSNLASILKTVTDTLNKISIAVAVIAGISLLVGGLGVMNIMLVSVTERTREIGTRKALGAKNAQIRLQFVTEALIITLVGGVIGLVFGIAAGAIIVSNMFDDITIIISPLVTAGSVLFSILIGVFFGWYPANKAARLNPIEALRYE